MNARAVAAALVLLAACSNQPTAPNFTLTSDTGASWELSQQHAPVLLTFGYAHCGDTCPAMLARLSRIADSRAAHGLPQIRIAMISVDPQRDTPATLHAFVARFPHVVGLTGTQAQIDAVETAYHEWAQRLPRKNANYDYAHATPIYAIDASGKIVALRDGADSDASVRSAIDAASSG